MAGYYRKIKGKDYDRNLLETAEKAVKGRGDGRISLADARKLVAIVRDSGVYSNVEKRTMSYIRDHFDFTPESDRWFRTEIRKWAATKGAGKKPAAKKKPVEKKAAPKAVAKKAPSRKAAPKAKAAAPRRREKRIAPSPGERLAAITREEAPVQAPREERQKAAPPKKKGGWNIIMILFIIAILIIVVMVANRRLGLNLGCSRDKEQKEAEEKIQNIEPVGEDKIAVPKQETSVTINEEAAPEKVPGAKVLEKSDQYDIYTVGVKDSLVSISEKETGDYRNWAKIFNANRDIIQNPKLIFPGQQIRIPKQ